ncbi:Intron-binding aquarius [Micractinium conductrix]|uniref:Intron-binding aquarius n=1 Tax=Micractinium conductrix TaxID=554055 RepID=A0A2P6V3R4_9CHLO|nr:Intron-binding aquarius [Micractinium conductrix]|eukprot:PSC68726.1 Intron-binding aquarius [Micractinium conductrix]
MPGTEWVDALTVAKLKDELKKRGQPVSGKKAELAERLHEYIAEHEGTREQMSAAKKAAGAGGSAAAGGDEEEASEDPAAAEAAAEPEAQPAAAAEPAAAAAEPEQAAAQVAEQAAEPAAEQPAEPAAGAEQQEAAAMEVDGGAGAAEAPAAPGGEAAAAAAGAGKTPGTGKQRKRGGKKKKQGQTPGQPGKPAGVTKRSGVAGRGRGGRGGTPAAAPPAAGATRAAAGEAAGAAPQIAPPAGVGALAEANWSARALAAEGGAPEYDPQLVAKIYKEELGGGGDKPPASRRVQLLEISQYLENYLARHLAAGLAGPAAYEHVMSTLLLVNQKFREQVAGWAPFRQAGEDALPALFTKVLALKGEEGERMRMHERVAFLVFWINAFQSLEDEAVRAQVLRLVSLPLWHALSRGRLQLELHDQPQLAKHWRHLAKREAKAAAQEGHVPVALRPEAAFLPGLLDEFLAVVQGVVPAGAMEEEGDAAPKPLDRQALLYCERFVELLTDLLSQLPTRRFVHAVLEDRAILVKAYSSGLYRHPQGRLFVQLVDLLRFYLSFPIHDHTGDPLAEEEVTAAHYEKVQQLQRLLFKHVPKLRELALANCGTVEKREVLRKELAGLAPDELRFLVTRQLRLVNEDDPWAQEPGFLAEVMVAAYERRRSQADAISEMPLYPTEAVLFDENQVPSMHYTGEGVLALPKLNLQFLTFHDYMVRNFQLFRLEATYEIREDLADVLQRVQPYAGEDGRTGFGGWARMAQLVDKFSITEVRKPKVGEAKPAGVTAEITLNLGNMRPEMRAEWDELRQHDVLFLLTVRPPDALTASYMAQQQAEAGEGGKQPNAMEKFGLQYVRGCEVVEIRDEDGKLMNDFTGRVRIDERGPPAGTVRTVTVALDTAQYQMDMNYLATRPGAEDVYGTFNLLMRRKAKENNFKAVLESIRDLMGEEDTLVLPPWLHDILLGYGDPGAADYRRMDGCLQTVDFKDTFLDADHVREAFPDWEIEFKNSSRSDTLQRPFRITFPPLKQDDEGSKPKGGKRKAGGGGDAAADGEGAAEGDVAAGRKLVVESYTPVLPGPYPEDLPPQNSVRFTPVQTQAIMAGVQPGLTMVVGPPGTGKTDTAVQIMHILYHNCPNQRTLVVTHSNQALNDLFTKIVERDVPARYLLRLGMGEAELETELDFSRVGRVNALLARRLELLAEVERLAKLLSVSESVAYTCETAAHFWLLHVLARWEKFAAQCSAAKTPACVKELFPFTPFFADAPQPLFKGERYAEDWEKAQGCFRHLRTMFQELEEIRPFELLKSQGDRVNYLMTKQAKIVAMTCTHAALKRKEFLDLGFKYDNLLMEESAQILEIETFIPMLLQRPEDGHNRLKRVVLIGDHHQLPPVVKNQAIQQYSRLDQSLFTRFIRLGTPYIELNAQGRARPSMAKLYNWRYRALGDLPNVATVPAFQVANPGFAHTFQLIDVPDFNGRGESCPLPYFYQNLGEAEMLVSVFQYMRLLGYPAHKISVLTTYNGQKALLRDVFERRCARHPAFGRPAKVTTVDKYQGQQNDYVLLSLVRTNHFGHLRDVRRLVVAMSRARLGLYVFGRAGLFTNCFELQPTFSQLLARPLQLALVPGEYYGACERPAEDVPVMAQLVSGVAHMAGIVQHMAQQWEAAAASYARASTAQAAPVGDASAAAAGAVEAAVAATAPPAERQEEVGEEEAAEQEEEEEAGEGEEREEEEEEEGSGDEEGSEQDGSGDEGGDGAAGDAMQEG